MCRRLEHVTYVRKRVIWWPTVSYDNPHRVLIVTGEDDEQDSYAEVDEAYIANFICDTRTAVLFSPTEIVFDNAAGMDVFMNPNLLSERKSSPIVRIGGVELDSGGLNCGLSPQLQLT